MVWWFTIPLVWGAKKIYDAVTESDVTANSSEVSSKVSSSKTKRTKARKKKIRNILIENRKNIIEKELAAENIRIYNSTNDCTGARLDLSGFNNELIFLHRMLQEFDSSHETPIVIEKTNEIFENIETTINKIIKKVNASYGSMAGINSHNEYDESTDPFLIKLRIK